MEALFNALKAWLRSNQEAYVTQEVAGDTEHGYYTETTFDFNALMREIDDFSETFKVPDRRKHGR